MRKKHVHFATSPFTMYNRIPPTPTNTNTQCTHARTHAATKARYSECLACSHVPESKDVQSWYEYVISISEPSNFPLIRIRSKNGKWSTCKSILFLFTLINHLVMVAAALVFVVLCACKPKSKSNKVTPLPLPIHTPNATYEIIHMQPQLYIFCIRVDLHFEFEARNNNSSSNRDVC